MSSTGGDSRGAQEVSRNLLGAPLDLDREACLTMLDNVRIGRIALSMGALPVIVPVEYLLIGETVSFSVEGSSALRRSASGAVIAFQVDGQNEGGRLDWSVLVRGVAQDVVDAGEDLPVRSTWDQRRPDLSVSSRFLVLPTTMISGQRFGHGF